MLQIPSLESRDQARADRFRRASAPPQTIDLAALDSQLQEKLDRHAKERELNSRLEQRILSADEEAARKAELEKFQKKKQQEIYRHELLTMMAEKKATKGGSTGGALRSAKTGLDGFSADPVKDEAVQKRKIQAELLKQTLYEKALIERENAVSGREAAAAAAAYVPRDQFSEQQRRFELNKQFEQENLKLAAGKKSSPPQSSEPVSYAPFSNENLPAPVAQAEFRGFGKEKTREILLNQPSKFVMEEQRPSGEAFAFVSSEEARLQERRRLAREMAAENSRTAALKKQN